MTVDPLQRACEEDNVTLRWSLNKTCGAQNAIYVTKQYNKTFTSTLLKIDGEEITIHHPKVEYVHDSQLLIRNVSHYYNGTYDMTAFLKLETEIRVERQSELIVHDVAGKVSVTFEILYLISENDHILTISYYKILAILN